MTERRMPGIYTIARYWAHTYTPQVQGLAPRILVTDLGEPSCFACGWYRESAPCYPEVTCWMAWQKAGLERAHLKPHSLDGDGHPSNFALLCPECHCEAPDWDDPTEMLAWVIRRPSHLSLRAAQFEAAWKSVRPDTPFPPVEVDTDRLRELLTARASTHGPSLSMTTLALAAAAMWDEQSAR